MTLPIECPHCHVHLDEGDVLEYYITEGYEKCIAEELAKSHGYTKDKPLRFTKAIAEFDVVEEKLGYHYKCPNCQEILREHKC